MLVISSSTLSTGSTESHIAGHSASLMKSYAVTPESSHSNTPMASFSFSEVLATYKNKRVLITGHTGFKGSWLSMILSNAGAQVCGYSLAPDHKNSLFSNLEKKLHMESVFNDIRDTMQLRSAVRAFQPEFIFHLAAQSLVRYSYLHPIETYEVNVMGTANVLEVLRRIQNKCTTIIVTTDKVYENKENGIPFRESDQLGGHDPYSSSKAAAELVAQSYQRSFFPLQDYNTHQKAIATARAGNVIGGGDRAEDRILPDLIRAFESGTSLQLRNPSAIRPWQHVLDPLAGYLKLAMLLHTDPKKYTGSYNFGPNAADQLSVKQIVEMAIAAWGSGGYETPDDPRNLHEARNLTLDTQKAQNNLLWQPKWNAKQAVERTVDWFKEVGEGNYKCMELCNKDIKAYINN